MGVVLAGRLSVSVRVLPYSGLDGWRDRLALLAQAPRAAGGKRGDMEDWLGWAVRNLSDGRSLMLREVDPEPTVGQLYRRCVLRVEAGPAGGQRRPQPSRKIPEGLVGRRAPGGA